MDALKISKWLINYLKEHYINIDSVERGNGYFIFEFGDNRVTHFTIKNRKWKFGIWITESEDSKTHISLFGEHIDMIDKFKPSQTVISHDLKVDNNEDFNKFIEKVQYSTELYAFRDDLERIQRYPILAYRWLYDYSFKEYLKSRWYYNVTDKINTFKEEKFNLFICKCIKFLFKYSFQKEMSCEIIDMRDFWSPKFEIKFRHFSDDNELVYKQYNRWFKSKYIGFGHMIRINHYYKNEKRGFSY